MSTRTLTLVIRNIDSPLGAILGLITSKNILKIPKRIENTVLDMIYAKQELNLEEA